MRTSWLLFWRARHLRLRLRLWRRDAQGFEAGLGNAEVLCANRLDQMLRVKPVIGQVVRLTMSRWPLHHQGFQLVIAAFLGRIERADLSQYRLLPGCDVHWFSPERCGASFAQSRGRTAASAIRGERKSTPLKTFYR